LTGFVAAMAAACGKVSTFVAWPGLAATVTNDPTHMFVGGNIDSLNASNRIADNTHLNDTGAAAAATLVYNAHACQRRAVLMGAQQVPDDRQRRDQQHALMVRRPMQSCELVANAEIGEVSSHRRCQRRNGRCHGGQQAV
jgi:hypothetical protein